MRRKGILFILIGPSGSGKSSLGQELLGQYGPQLALSISMTSRAPREGEKEGEHYYFVSREDFQKHIDAGDFFEWEEIHGNFYGTLKKTLDDAISEGRDLLLDIDIRGACSFKEQYQNNVVAIFLLPPSFEALEQRIRKRGSITEKDIEERFRTAQSEYKQMQELVESGQGIDYILVNDDFEEAKGQLQSIYSAETYRALRINAEDLSLYCQLPEKKS